MAPSQTPTEFAALSPAEVVAAIGDAIREIARVGEVSGSTALRDLPLTSLDLLEVITIIEDRFNRDIDGIRLISSDRKMTVEDLAVAFVAKHAGAAE